MPPYRIDVEFTPEFSRQTVSAIMRYMARRGPGTVRLDPRYLLVLLVLTCLAPFPIGHLLEVRGANIAPPGYVILISYVGSVLFNQMAASGALGETYELFRKHVSPPIIAWEFSVDGYSNTSTVRREQGSWAAIHSLVRAPQVWLLNTTPYDCNPLPADQLTPELRIFLEEQIRSHGGKVL